MSRAIRLILATVVALISVGVLCGIVLFFASNGEILRDPRALLLRVLLTTRTEDLNRRLSTNDSPVRFTVAIGDSPRIVADNLYRDSLIADADLFVDYVRAYNIDVQLEAGTFFLNRAMSIPEIASALTDSTSGQFLFRILEGWRLEEIAAAIDANPYFGFSGEAFLAVAGRGAAQDPAFVQLVGLPQGASLEGFLFPDTYQLPAAITPIMLRDMLTQTYAQRVGADIQASAASQGWSLYEVVTLASIVQREAVHPDEHAAIAGVYRNRLDIDMKLDADPTVQYAIGFENGSWWPQITQADYTSAVSPYNTYLNTGLPPGPISNPGLSAIQGVVNPEESPYLYFRAACDGSGYHNFARTFEEHLANACS